MHPERLQCILCDKKSLRNSILKPIYWAELTGTLFQESKLLTIINSFHKNPPSGELREESADRRARITSDVLRGI